MANVTSALEAHEAYVERVKAEFHGPRYDWFLEYLSRSYYVSLPVENSWLDALEFDGNTAPKHVLHASASSDLQEGLLHDLKSDSSPAVTRVVLLYYPWLNFLNLKYNGAKGYILGLDPWFFIERLTDSHRGRLDIHRRPLSHLQLNPTFLQFQFQEGRRITACTVQNTVVILYEFRSDEPGFVETLTKPLFTNLSCLQSEEAMSNLKSPPIDLVAMILEAETLNLITAIDIEDAAICEGRSLKETAISKLMVVGHWGPRDWESYWSGRVMIEGTVRSLSAALASKQWSKGGAPLANRLLEELRTVLDRSRFQGEYVRQGVQQIHTMASIEETRKGIQQADSVRRLTLVAFVFIPLNFATSFFGMNVQQLGSGSVNIGYFFLAAALIGGFATLLSSIVKPLERQVQYKREEIADELNEDVGVIQKREIFRQSKLGKRLWRRGDVVELDNFARFELERPGPKTRNAMKLSANNRWKKLTKSRVDSATRQPADPERQVGCCDRCRELGARMGE